MLDLNLIFLKELAKMMEWPCLVDYYPFSLENMFAF